MTFTDYAAKEGCNLLRDDIKYIQQRIKCIPQYKRKEVLTQYVAIWQKHMLSCGDVIKKENVGRYQANTWLRELTDTASKQEV